MHVCVRFRINTQSVLPPTISQLTPCFEKNQSPKRHTLCATSNALVCWIDTQSRVLAMLDCRVKQPMRWGTNVVSTHRPAHNTQSDTRVVYFNIAACLHWHMHAMVAYCTALQLKRYAGLPLLLICAYSWISCLNCIVGVHCVQWCNRWL